MKLTSMDLRQAGKAHHEEVVTGYPVVTKKMAQAHGIDPRTVRSRIRAGMSLEEALITPLMSKVEMGRRMSEHNRTNR